MASFFGRVMASSPRIEKTLREPRQWAPQPLALVQGLKAWVYSPCRKLLAAASLAIRSRPALTLRSAHWRVLLLWGQCGALRLGNTATFRPVITQYSGSMSSIACGNSRVVRVSCLTTSRQCYALKPETRAAPVGTLRLFPIWPPDQLGRLY